MDKLFCNIVEENGENGFASYRVPCAVTASNGDVILCYEGRSEDGSRTLFMRRSADGGHSFQPRELIAAPAEGQLLHNPIMISAADGLVLLFWCADYGKLYMRRSEDNGKSYGPVMDITSIIDGFRNIWPVTLWAVAPGHGIEMSDGALVLPLWLSRGENAHLPAAFACIYSKDRGETWCCSNVVPAGNGVGDPTEASVAELSDGTLLATMRHEITGVRKRAFCDGGPEKWGEAYLSDTLPDPICSGALLRLSKGKIAFVNCANEDLPALAKQAAGENVRWSMDARKNLTLRYSADDGKTWSAGILLCEEAGASDLTLSGENVLCFHEEGWTDGNCIFNKKLVLSAVTVKSLLAAK